MKNFDELLLKYCLTFDQLNMLVSDVKETLSKQGTEVIIDPEYFNRLLGRVDNNLAYLNHRVVKDENLIHGEGDIDCISDGKDIYYQIGANYDGSSICLHLFDLIHLGMGHIWQWNLNATVVGFKYHGLEAWEAGKRAYKVLVSEEGAIAKLQSIKLYEEEGTIIAKQNLEKLLTCGNYTDDFKNNFRKFFQDFSRTNIKCLLHHCENGEYLHLLQNWEVSDRYIDQEARQIQLEENLERWATQGLD